MRKRRIISLLLAVTLALSSLSFTVLAESATPEATPAANEWTAKSGPKELTVTHVDESDNSSSPDTDEFYRLYDFKNSTGEDALTYTLASSPFTTGKTYRMYAYMRSLVHVNEAAYGDYRTYADNTNNMTVRMYYGGTEMTSANITDQWTLYSADFKAAAGGKVFKFQRHYYGSEDTVPFDVDGVYFVEIDASGNEIGNRITPAGVFDATADSTLLTVNKAEEAFDRIEIPTEEETVNVIGSNNTSLQRPQTNTVSVTDGFGFTVQLTGSDDVILAPGKYNFNGDFRLGWVDHSKLVFEDGSFSMIAADNNTAPLQAYFGSTLLGSADLNPSTWTNVSKTLEITEETSMSKLKIEIGAIVPVDYKNLKLEYVEFGSDDGDVGKVTPSDESYIAVRGRDHFEDSVAYVDTVTTYNPAKTYEISFKARVLPFTAGNATVATKPAMIRIFSSSTLLLYRKELTADWTQITVTATNYTGEFNIKGSSSGYGFAPFDIKDLKIVEEGKTENLAENANGLFENGAGWKVYANVGSGLKNFTVTTSDTDEFFRVSKPTTGVTSFTYASDEAIEPGIYYVSGDFKLNEKIDFGKYTSDSSSLTADANSAKLGVKFKGETLRTLDASSEVAINPETYTSVTFVLNLETSAKKSDLEFVLDGAYSLDFKNINIENKEDEFDTSLVSGDGSFISKVDADKTPYIRASGRDYMSDTLVYRDTVSQYDPAKTYEISFKARTDGYIPGDDPIGVNPATFRISFTDGGGYFVRTLTLTSEFTTCGPYEVTGFPGSLAFCGSPLGYGVAPIDIKDLVITEKGTTENLAANAVSLFENGAGWEMGTNGGLGLKEFAVSSVIDEDYLMVPASSAAGVGTSFTYASDDQPGPGIYHISGSFILKSPIDYNKYTFESSSQMILTNGNTDSLTVSVGGNTIKTLDGETSVVINPESWTDATFKLIVDANDTVLMSDINFAFGSAVNVGIRDIEIFDASGLYDAEYIDGNGNAVAIIDESAEETHITFDGRDSYEDRLVYSAGNIAADTYTISFKARTKPFIAGDSATIASKPAIIRTYATTVEGGNKTVLRYAHSLSTEWSTISATLEGFTGEFYITGSSSGYGFAPVDIKDLSIVKEGTDENVAKNALSLEINGAGWSVVDGGGSLKSLSVTVNDGSIYNRISATEGANTELHFVDNKVLTPGIYHITGKFKLHGSDTVDYTKYESDGNVLTADGNMVSANLSAWLGGVPLMTMSGSGSAALSDSWREVTFVLDTMVDLDLNTLMLMLDGAYTLDFKELDVTLIERRVDLSSVNSGIVMVLLMLKQKELDALGFNTPWVAVGSSYVQTVDKVLDEATGISGDEDGAVSNGYIHLGGRDYHDDRIVYENVGQTLTAGTYKLSFWARGASVVNAPESVGNSVTSMRVMLGSSQMIYLASEKTGSFQCSDTVLGKDWAKYSYTFSITEDQPFKFMIRGSSRGNSVAPIDIDGFTLIKLDPTTKKPLTEENLAVDRDALMTGVGGWYAENVDGKLYDISASEEIESEFIRVKADSDGIASVKNSGSRKLEPGKYFVTAKARIGTIDFLKYGIKEGGMVLESDENNASLSATLAGETLMTTDGKDTAVLTPEWTEVTFVINVTEPTPVNKVRLIAEGAPEIDFDYINIDTKVNKVDMDAFDPESGTGLPPVILENEADLLDGAVTKELLPYWTTDGQTLEAREDENGVYFAASNITSNTLGFTYQPGFKIKAGTYRFTAQMRTTNEGEMSMIRLSVGDDFGSAMIDNTWRTVSITITVPKTMDFALKIYGGPMKNNTKDYEFRNARFMDVNYVPTEENLYENGTFNNEATVSGEWKMGYGAGDISVNTDEGGNKYLTSKNRKDSDAPIVLSLVYSAVPGNVYTISYDIRTSNAGEAMNIRTAIGTDIDTLSILSESHAITDEWTRVEYTFIPLSTKALNLWINGVQDDTSFDIDNVSIVKNEDISAAIPEGGKYYLGGDFENAETALDGWSIAEGTGVIGIASEDGNSYLTITDRKDSTIPATLTTGYPVIVGRTYRIAYDARTSNAGETIHGRASFLLEGTTYDLKLVEGLVGEERKYLPWYTNEWEHYEFEITVDKPGELVFQLKGGPRGEPDNKHFDVDNLVIELVD